TFLHKPYDEKKAMIEALRGPFDMTMIMQEINRYADSEFRYSDRADDSAVERIIRDARLRERAIGEIEELKKKGAWG
ncbi:MAG: AAA family ATPase, partial [Rhizobiaceae bacterium]